MAGPDVTAAQRSRPRGLLANRRLRRGVPPLLAYLALGTSLIAACIFSLEAALTKSWVFVATVAENFPRWGQGPLVGPGAALIPGRFAGLTLGRYLALVGVWGICYLAILYWATLIRPRYALGVIVCVHLLLLLTPLLFSPDLFNVVAYARLGTHGLNPYLWGANQLGADPVVAFVPPDIPLQPARSAPNPYGPLFTAASYPFAGLSLPAALWSLKTLTTAASLGCVGAVWKAAKRFGHLPTRAALFVGLNPLLLIWGVGGAHNDVWLMLFVALGAYFAASRRVKLTPAALTAAACIKATGGLLIPFAVLGSPDRRKALAGAMGAIALAAALTLLVFGTGSLNMVHTLAAISNWPGEGLYDIPKLVGSLAHSTPLATTIPTPGIRRVSSLAFLVAAAVLLGLAWRRRDWITTSGWALLALFVTSSWLWPWYLVAVLPLAAISRSKALRWATVGLAAALLVLGFPVNTLL